MNLPETLNRDVIIAEVEIIEAHGEDEAQHKRRENLERR